MIAKVAAIASKLAMAARQQELTALEMAGGREAAARPARSGRPARPLAPADRTRLEGADLMTVLSHVPTLERALVDAGFPAMTPWWRDALASFYESGRRQLVLRVGRRGGKSSTLCRVAVLEALFGEHYVPPGDVGVVAIISTSRDEAGQGSAPPDAGGARHRVPANRARHRDGGPTGRVQDVLGDGRRRQRVHVHLRDLRRSGEVARRQHRREPGDRGARDPRGPRWPGSRGRRSSCRAPRCRSSMRTRRRSTAGTATFSASRSRPRGSRARG